MKRTLFLTLLAFLSWTLKAQTTYTWNGSTSSDWTLAANWTPSRAAVAGNDVLVFDGSSASTLSITNVTSQTIGSILVTGNGAFSLTPSGNKVLTLTVTTGNTIQIDNGSSLSVGAAGNALDITLPASSGTASIGGQLTLVNGNFGINAGKLILHTNPTPLARTGGQISMSAGSVLQFGLNGGSENTGTIVLPNQIFIGSINIASIVMNRTNGAQLSDQTITLSSGVTFTLGDLRVPNNGTLIFGAAASDPVLTESLTSKIIGYAEMQLRGIGTGALDFLGFSMAAGADNLLGIGVKRQTGSPITFNTVPSIAAVWNVTTVSPPSSGRDLSFKWLSTFDGVYSSANKFQAYINDGSPGWTTIGTQQFLTSGAADLRVSAPATTTQFGFDFTLTDNTATLPVELLFFKGKLNTNDVQLTWATASETNFNYFIVERSADGKSFQQLGTVSGSGTSKSRHDYSFTDSRPLSGINYYRLKEVDFDQMVTSLGIVSANFNGAKDFTVFPNPVSSGSSLTIYANFNDEPGVKISITDLSGKPVTELLLNSQEVQLPVTLSPGLYIVTFQSASAKRVERLLVN
ncbi:MAG: T9SS type A sorting domain-containing protein [Bacteroidetes bacterium]|nr:T9SS type A sorting domain-containing protein [Bacteroidota bacterium]